MRNDGMSASAIVFALVSLTSGAFGQQSIRTPDLSAFQNFLPNTQQEISTGQTLPEEGLPEQSTASPINAAPLSFQGATIRLGPFTGVAGAAIGYSFNDNAGTSEAEKVSLNQVFENLNFNLIWPLSPFNRINVQLGTQLQENFYSDGRNALNVVILPGSQILLQAKAGEFLVNAYERLSVTQDPVSDPSLAGETNLNQLTNTLGVGVVWPLYKLNLSLNLDYTYSDAFGSTFSTINNTGTGGSVLNSFHVGTRAAFEITPQLSAGPEINATYNAGGGGDDFDVLSVGGFLRGHLTRLIEVDGGIGVLFLGGPAGGPPGYYAYLTVRHELSRNLQIIAGVDHDSEFSIGLGVTQNNNVRLTAEAQLTRQWVVTLGPEVNFGTVITGILPGRYTQYGLTVDSAFKLNPRWTADFNYRFAKRDGDQAGGSYTQNLFTFTLNYGF
jgi:hypothetical protein